ncbi:uncharacterized protein FFB20_02661 [Fusarium fujikuroi]|uniref:Uncharacterized protein n=1 Tax=Fusarium fujikuroi TaxID=5127 RepID=A0A2H3S5N8_FUSFU|nr:hypothetical protein CEK27_010380 [Fusarium fujikuroi]QGI83646.1 hypothetical protein CEK25_010375 [Fusarium fujikuroi]QGI97296.1 hypothetical protein CEK26_010365 [Fusarium fujikuroi]SCN67568.1 uncharacterized protein FFB20_02661 [Fusarium fujikuroi]SCN86132.1 uncharacterized protein FFC1_05067 [Fusarium fujikuroi]
MTFLPKHVCLLRSFVIFVLIASFSSAWPDCGNGHARCHYEEGQTLMRQVCKGNRWHTVECCEDCRDFEGVSQAEAECLRPYSLQNDKCPASELGGKCWKSSGCLGHVPCVKNQCQKSSGDLKASCEPGKEHCYGHYECFAKEKKCLYPFRGECLSNDCGTPEELGPDTTVQCKNDPYGRHKTRCLPVLAPNGKCVSGLDCLRGDCKDGICTGEGIPDGEECNPSNPQCRKGSTCNPQYEVSGIRRTLCGPTLHKPCDPAEKDDCGKGFQCSRNGECLYALRADCIQDACSQPLSLSANATAKCINNPFHYTPPKLCIPILTPGSPCESNDDCQKGVCTNGRCPENRQLLGEECDPGQDRCAYRTRCEEDKTKAGGNQEDEDEDEAVGNQEIENETGGNQEDEGGDELRSLLKDKSAIRRRDGSIKYHCRWYNY